MCSSVIFKFLLFSMKCKNIQNVVASYFSKKSYSLLIDINLINKRKQLVNHNLEKISVNFLPFSHEAIFNKKKMLSIFNFIFCLRDSLKILFAFKTIEYMNGHIKLSSALTAFCWLQKHLFFTSISHEQHIIYL